MAAPDAVILRSFAGGEIDPALAMRADLARYQTAARTVRNFVVRRSGGLSLRKGTRFIDACVDDDSNKRLIGYIHEDEAQSVLIEAGENYLRFFADDAQIEVDPMDVDAWDGGTDYVPGDMVTDGGEIYYCLEANTGTQPPADEWQVLTGGELIIPTPFDDPGIVNWHQSGRVITLTYRGKQPHELIFEGIANWRFRPVETAPIVPVPQNPVLTNTTGTRYAAYIITAASPDYEESEPSAIVVDASAAEPTPDAPHALEWDAVTVNGVPAPEYYVYYDPYGNGQFGLVGTAVGQTTFNNGGIAPDFMITPPIPRVLFATEDEYPHVSGTFEQRRFFGHTANIPDAVYGSRVGLPSNFGITSPLQDDDAVTFRVAENNNNAVRHMLTLRAGLMLMTAGGAFAVSGPEGKSIIPNGIQPRQRSYIPIANLVRPAVLGNGIVYIDGRASKPYELRLDNEVAGTEQLGGIDLSVFASHLFDGYTIVDVALQLTPDPIVWCVRSDGVLLGLTRVPEQDVWGWHRHDTQGNVERVCVLPGDGVDNVYLIVARDVGGTKRYIEKLAPNTKITSFDVDAFHLDSGLSYSGAPASSVSGLDHLEGLEVGVVGDGVYLGTFTVSGGAVALGASYSNIHAGLLFTGDVETLSIDAAGTSVRDKKKRVQAVDLVLHESARTFKAGRSSASLNTYKQPSTDSTAKAYSGKVEMSIASTFDDDGRMLIRQATPLPMTILGILPVLEVGG